MLLHTTFHLARKWRETRKMQADTGTLLPGGDFARDDVDPDRTLFGLVAIDKRPYLRPRYSQEAQYVAPTLLAPIRDATYPLIAFHQQYDIVALKKPLDHGFAQSVRELGWHRLLHDGHDTFIR